MKLISKDAANEIYANEYGQCTECGTIGPTTFYRLLGFDGRPIGVYEVCNKCNEGGMKNDRTNPG